MTDTTDIKALREASRRETFENQAAQYEKCSLSFIVSLRNKEGGYSNEKIDDMWHGFKLAVAPPWGRTVGEVAIESNRLFHEKKALLDQLEAERQRTDKAEARVKELEAESGDQVPVGFIHHLDVAELKAGGDAEVLPHKTADWQIPVFTAQQKPVLLPGISELIDACDCTPAVRDVHVWDLAISEVKRLNPSIFSEISAAGGIVKDGE